MQKREAIIYFENAKEILSNTPIEDNIYADIKPVQEACSTAYLAVLKAIDEYLLKKGLVPLNKGGLRGLLEKELPQSIDAYRNALKKHLAIHNGKPRKTFGLLRGKLTKEFEVLYDELHIAGYYRGNLSHTKVVKEVFKSAKEFIE